MWEGKEASRICLLFRAQVEGVGYWKQEGMGWEEISSRGSDVRSLGGLDGMDGMDG